MDYIYMFYDLGVPATLQAIGFLSKKTKNLDD